MVEICHCPYSWKAIWVESVFCPLCTGLEWTGDCKNVLDVTVSFPLAAGPATELLGHTEDLFLVSRSIAPLFLIMAALIYNFTSSECTPFSPRPWPHLFNSAFLIIAILSKMLSHSGFAFPSFTIMCLFSTNSFDCSCNWTKTKYWKAQLPHRTFCEFKYLIRPSEGHFAAGHIPNFCYFISSQSFAYMLPCGSCNNPTDSTCKRRPCFYPGSFAFPVLSTQNLTFSSSPLVSLF